MWTEDLVLDALNDAITILGLNRMPTHSELATLPNGNSINCAMGRRGGTKHFAKLLNLDEKKSETTLGKKYEELAAKSIQEMGYIATQMPQNFPYDILVNNCVKVDVKVSNLYTGDIGSFFSFRMGKKYCTCDIYFLYAITTEIQKLYIVPSKIVYNNTQISIGEASSKYSIYLDKWDYLKQYVDFMEDIC